MTKMTALFLASAAFLVWHQRSQTIEPPNAKGDGMEGVSCAYATVFNGAAVQGTVCVIDGAKLQAGKSYDFNGALLVVRGDVPERASIDAGHAKVFIEGNVGKQVEIEANKPENFLTVTAQTSVMMACGLNCVMLVPTTVENIYSTGFTYPDDKDPMIVVTGNTGLGVSFDSNGSHKVAYNQPDVYRNYFMMPAARQALSLH